MGSWRKDPFLRSSSKENAGPKALKRPSVRRISWRLLISSRRCAGSGASVCGWNDGNSDDDVVQEH